MVSLQEAAYLAVGFVVFVVTVSIGGSVLYGVQGTQWNTATAGCTQALMYSGQANCTTVASNASAFGLTGISNIATNSAVIGTILGATIILGLLMTAFMKRE